MNFIYIIYGLFYLIKVFMFFMVGIVKDVWVWVNVRIWFNVVDVQFYELIMYLGKDFF